MSVITISVNKGAKKKSTRVGRGTGNGTGNTCGRGHKGQKSRSGGNLPAWFEGGQMPLYRRIPKRGFKSLNKVFSNLVNIENLNGFKDGEDVNVESLLKKGLIKNNGAPVKILAMGDLKVKNLKIKVSAVSGSARKKLEDSGCQIGLITD